ncbi:hypothetical protein BpHYR1_040174 [Brachionus plicatilis]|uniref:Uncharacterized protein n=1 Tax=Brachionus plicatilis TaxID=10195 RepID=A0A3M7QRU3_BRAPC|nr:hypothetical protein BpHYR1_040174 [Brachionus plicatilis]
MRQSLRKQLSTSIVKFLQLFGLVPVMILQFIIIGIDTHATLLMEECFISEMERSKFNSCNLFAIKFGN